MSVLSELVSAARQVAAQACPESDMSMAAHVRAHPEFEAWLISCCRYVTVGRSLDAVVEYGPNESIDRSRSRYRIGLTGARFLLDAAVIGTFQLTIQSDGQICAEWRVGPKHLSQRLRTAPHAR